MEHSKKVTNIICLVSICILFILPFPQGLFYENQLLYVELAIFATFLIFIVSKYLSREKVYIHSKLAFAVILLPVVYLLPLITGTAVDKTTSFNYFLRYVGYLAMFLLAKEIIKTDIELKKILYALGVSGILCGLLGIDSLADGGIGTLLKFNAIDFNYDRLRGIFQYSNTSAIFYGMTFFVLTMIISVEKNKFIKAFASGTMFIMITVLLLTVSRGAILAVAIAYIVLFILLPNKKNRIELILTTIAPIILTLILYPKLQSASPIINEATGNTMTVWIIAVAGIVVSAIITYLLMLLSQTLNNISSKVYIITIAILGVILIAGVAVLFYTGAYTKIIPQFLLERFQQTGVMATSGRIDFYRDGVKLLKDNWILGTGGGGWEALYRIYQSYAYTSTQAHNMLLQVWIETGILGALLYIFIIVMTIVIYIKTIISKKNNIIITMLLVIVGLLMGHSMIDFNFSYFSIPCIVFFLLGCVDSLFSETNSSKLKINISLKTGIAVSAIPLLITISFSISRIYQKQARELLGSGVTQLDNLHKATGKIKTATIFNPINIEYYINTRKTNSNKSTDLATICSLILEQDSFDTEILNLYNKSVQKGLKLNPKNPVINGKIGNYYVSTSID